MSLLDQLQPLPALVNVPNAVQQNQADKKRFVIILSKDMSEDDKKIFAQHGKILEWSPKLVNISFESLEFQYLLIDARQKEARLTLGRQDLSKYNKVVYCWWIQKGVDDFIGQLDAVDISSVPTQYQSS
jgi:hypothetical protein